MFSYKFIVVSEKNNAVRLRIVNNRKKSEINVGISMPVTELEKILMGFKGASALHTSLIRQWQSQLEIVKVELLRDGRTGIDVKELKNIIQDALFSNSADADKKESDKLNWEKFYVKYIETKKNKSYRESCQYTLNKMRELCDNFSELQFDGITLKWLKDFDAALAESGASQNTRNIHFKNIRTCLNRAIDEEMTNNYPFRRFKLKAEETRKRSLTIEELREFIDADVEEYQQFYKDMFLLSFYLIGCNAVDMYSLSDITPSGRVEYRRAKTHKLYSIKAEPEAMEIIERWRGKMNLLSISERWKDYRDFTKNINIALKKIGKVQRKGRGGKKIITPRWPDLSLYWARHTWATIAYSLDIPGKTGAA